MNVTNLKLTNEKTHISQSIEKRCNEKGGYRFILVQRLKKTLNEISIL